MWIIHLPATSSPSMPQITWKSPLSPSKFPFHMVCFRISPISLQTQEGKAEHWAGVAFPSSVWMTRVWTPNILVFQLEKKLQEICHDNNYHHCYDKHGQNYFSSFSQKWVTYCSWSSFSFLFILLFSLLLKRQPEERACCGKFHPEQYIVHYISNWKWLNF